MPKGEGGRKVKEFNVDTTSVTPRDAVWKRNKAVLWYYPAPIKTYHTPLFLVYSLINEPSILDLAPGMSMIEAFTKCGYDVYLLDFGKPGYEDKDVSLDDYIMNYMQNGVEQALRHAQTMQITMIGYCLGGTLAAIFTAVDNKSIKNLVLFAPPIDFSEVNFFPNWVKSLKNDSHHVEQLINDYGIIPSHFIEKGLRIATSPFAFAPKLSSGNKKNDLKRKLVKQWLSSHIPFSGATLKQIVNELGRENKLIRNQLVISGQTVRLSNINANLLVLSTTDDHIVLEEQTLPLMNKVSSADKTYKRVKGGHISLALKGEIPNFLIEWLDKRSASEKNENHIK